MAEQSTYLVWAVDRIAQLTRENEALRAALMDVAARARFELDHPTEMRDTAFSLIEKSARAALALKEPGQ